VSAVSHVTVGKDAQARAARRRAVPKVVVAAISAPVRTARTRFARSLSLVNMASASYSLLPTDLRVLHP